MWPWKKPRETISTSALAKTHLEISPEDMAYDAIAMELGIDSIPDETLTAKASPAYSEPSTPAELSPEYHASLAIRMTERLDADETRLTDAIEAEQRQHDDLMAALHAELAGVRKVREAYAKVGDILSEPDQVSGTVKSQRMTRGKRSSGKPAIIVDHALAE